MHHKKIIIGMSGGVDSSTAAYELTRSGQNVEGVFMRNWEDNDNHCTNATDMQDAIQICDKLRIPLPQ